MTIWRNGALWAAASAIGLFWLSDAVLGTGLNRDVVDIVSIFFCTIMAGRLIPDAVDRFRRGGVQRNWQLLMSNFLFFSGWAMFSAWAFAVRGFGRPEWMIESPINGFLRFWILGAAVTAFFSTTEIPTPLNPTKVYYIVIGVLGGILIGVAGSQAYSALVA